MKNLLSSLFLVSLLVLVLGLGAGCKSRPTANGGSEYGNSFFKLTIPPAYSVKVNNNAAPILRVEKGGLVIAQAVPLSDSVLVPFHLFETDQSEITVKGYRPTTNGMEYIGMNSYRVYPQGSGRLEVITVDYLQRPRPSY